MAKKKKSMCIYSEYVKHNSSASLLIIRYSLKMFRATKKFRRSKQSDSSAALTALEEEKIPVRFAGPFEKAVGRPPN